MFDSLRQLFSLFTPTEKRQAYRIFMIMLVMAFLDVVGVASIMPFMAAVSNPETITTSGKLHAIYAWAHFTSPRSFLLTLGFIVLGFLLIGNSYSIYTTWVITRFASLREYTLSKRLLTKYLSQPYAFFLNQNTAELTSNLLTEVQRVVNWTFIPGLQMLAKCCVVTLMLALLFFVNFFLALTSIVFLGGAYASIYLLVRRRLVMMSDVHVQKNQLRHKIVSEALGGIKDIKLLGKENVFLTRYSAPAYTLAHDAAVANTVALVPRYALESIAFGGVLLIVIYFLITKQHLTDVMPMLALYAFACFRLMPALQNIFSSLTTMRASKGALQAIYNDLGFYQDDEFRQKNAITVSQTINNPFLFTEVLTLHDVVFTYENAKQPAVNHLSLTIPAKSVVGFVGKTGSGKTTTIDLILGLLCPAQGYLAVDGQRLSEENLHAWQKKIGYVPQFIYLADDSVMRNIAFGIPDEDIDSQAVERAARLANIHDFVQQELPDQYQTLIGERGVRLSGGQRQRIGIARALYHNPEVLVLDEATSSLDGVTENIIMEAVSGLSHQKTIIIVAHRLTTIKECDVIYLFDKGCITKSGTYQVLIENDAFFRAMAEATSL